MRNRVFTLWTADDTALPGSNARSADMRPDLVMGLAGHGWTTREIVVG